ncbi:MAG TPA: efflux RND transporter permease subunit [Myxococcota bacterium]
MKIADVSIDRPVFTTMVTVAAMVMGFMALARLSIDLFPDVSFPVVAITTTYPGAGPEEVEQQVTKRVEEVVATVNGIDTIRSYSRDSVSVVVVMFKLDVNELEANSDVRDRVQQVKALLPDDAEDPIIQKFDPGSAPILTYAVRAEGRTQQQITDLVDDIVKPGLESAQGVGAVVLKGGQEREIRVELEQSKLQGVGLSVGAVSQLLRAESLDLPGGRITVGGREFSIRANGRFTSADDVANTVLMSKPDGTQVRVKDVGEVKDDVAEVRTITRLNGEPAILFDVQKQSGANTVGVSDAVAVSLDKLKQQPNLKGVDIVLVTEQAKYIRNNLHNLREHLIVGGLLAILVIFFFMLDVRSTLISSLSLPTSVIATFFVVWVLGFSLNLMTMLAITLAIGLLIDDSVVVRENIFRHLEMGDDPVTAARKGTSEIALAVFATTMTIVAVFLPVAFMDGVVGRMFKQFGLTLTAAVLVSLAVSFTLDPMLSARIAQTVDPDRHEKMKTHWFYGPPTRLFHWMDHFYTGILKWSLRHKFVVVGGAFAMFFGSIFLVQFMGTEFMSKGDQGKFKVSFEGQAGIALAESDLLAKRAEQLLKTQPEVLDVITVVGVDSDASKFDITVVTTKKATRKITLDDIMNTTRERLAELPGVTAKLSIPGLVEGGAVQAPVQMIITGPDLKELERIGNESMNLLNRIPGTRDVAMDLRPGSPEQRFVVNRSRTADRGVAFAGAAQSLRFAVEGDIVATIPDAQGDDMDVRVRLRDEDSQSVSRLEQVVVASKTGALVRLDEIVDVIESPAPASITRSDRQRAITVTSNLAGRSLGEVTADLKAGMAKMNLAPGYGYKFDGEAKNMAETMTNMLAALGLAVIFIYLILASQFESFVHPFTIMLALPLAIIGALLGLFLSGTAIGMPAMIGIILLMGLVTKNGILLVDYTNQVRERTGKNAHDALIEAAPVRLRPILMTSAAIVLGELPTALSTAEGSEFNVPMAVAVIGGVITSTLLTLVVVPVAYTWIDKLSIKKYHQGEHAPPSTSTSASFTTPAE